MPASPAAMYRIADEGNLAAANDMVNNVWDVPRSAPVKLPDPAELTWGEDPYHDAYWRFQFYSLRPTSNLLWAYETTKKPVYATTLVAILRSFANYDATNPPLDRTRLGYKHGAAFRAMILTDDYVRLSSAGVLPPDVATMLRTSIAKLAVFLANPINYDGTYNHGFTEAAALLLVAVNFPGLQGVATLKQLAMTRLTALMENTVGSDGVEIERSPFYDFYVFDLALQVEDWAALSGVDLPVEFTDRVASMVRYATDIIWPNGQIPLIGSSVQEKPAGNGNLYAPLEKAYPEFAYALSAGAAGTPPADRATLFADSGQVIMRSPIGPSAPYADTSQVVLNDGSASTPHSHLDGLAITYYTDGLVLLPDSGLDTYAPGTTFDFFDGTSAHNTVLVDGKDQGSGLLEPGLVTSGSTWEYASGSAELVGGVTQKRSVLLLGRNLLLVVDSESSTAAHTYQQLWHLFPGAHVVMAGQTAEVSTSTDAPVLSITQASVPGTESVQSYYGNTNPMQGWYSPVYGQVSKNHVVGYSQTGTVATYLTLLATGGNALHPADVSGTVDTATGAVRAQVCGADSSAVVTITNQGEPDETVAVTPSTHGCSHGS